MHLALLRGINVGGHNKLPKKDLISIFHDVGCSDVKTYIQSGNIVYRAAPALARQIPQVIAESIHERFGYKVPVVTRTAEEVRAVVADNPYLPQEEDEKALHVGFLAEFPEEARRSSLDPNRSPPDEFTLRGREIYLRCPNGLARTRLTNAYFDSKLGTISTVRNWKTTLKLLQLVGG